MAHESNAPDCNLLERLLAFFETHPWKDATMDKAALDLDVPADVLMALYPTAEAVIEAFFKQTDTQTCAALRELGPAPFRDLLLEGLMIRLEILTPHKTLVRHLSTESLFHPCLAAALLTHTSHSLQQMLHAAGHNPSLPQHLLAGLVYARGLWAWFQDTSYDQAEALAAMDHCLRLFETKLAL